MRSNNNRSDDMELFWNTIADYNANTWIAQCVLIIIGALLTTLLFHRPSPAVRRAMKCYIVALNVWIAAVYYLWFCGSRPYNDAMVLVWSIMAAIWIYDGATGYTAFEPNRKHGRLATLFMLLPLAYPLISFARGMHFPMTASPVMPSSVALFTLGFMLAFSERVNLFIVLFQLHWALVGASKIYCYNIPEDALLVCAMIPAIYIFLREYVATNVSAQSKPDYKTAHRLLVTLTAGTGILFATLMLRPLIMPLLQ